MSKTLPSSGRPGGLGIGAVIVYLELVEDCRNERRRWAERDKDRRGEKGIRVEKMLTLYTPRYSDFSSDGQTCARLTSDVVG